MNQLNENQLIKPLLPEDPIYISCHVDESGEEGFILTQDGIHRYDEDVEKWGVKISGEKEQWEELFRGNLRLQQLMNLRMIQVEGRFRDILRFESILSLSQINSENSLTSDN